MEYILSNVFGQAASRYGIFAGLLAVAAFAAIAVAGYYAKARVDNMRQEAAIAAQERAQAHAERARETAARDSERQALIGELEKAREQTFKLMSNHLEHDKMEREELAATLSQINAESRAHVDALRALSDKHDDLHRLMGDLRLDMARKPA